ncbi:putative sporulation protein YtxC [Niallia taxi]|uniref:Putative sporulation protein YtxC n=1 Tax=Niallia taxi TaxID=2499688 RepID=A0A3S2X4C1_9BACI|nr:putative sporulation protein YtxC [Niallia taxi]
MISGCLFICEDSRRDFYFFVYPHIHSNKDFFHKGGLRLIEVIFQKKGDGEKLLRLINLKYKNTDWAISSIQEEHEFRLKFSWETGQNSLFMQTLKMVLAEFILHYKSEEWARQVLVDRYYYADEAEQRLILEILHSLLEKERRDLASLLGKIHLHECLDKALGDLLKDNFSFSFDSFVTFRLQDYTQKLNSYVEIAIDEYKMEQEYQVFIHTLRDFLENRSPKIQAIHVLVDLEIQFYDSEYRELSQQDLMKILDRKMFTYQSVYIDPFSIGPLLSLAPKNIYLYTEDREQPIVRTIMNIFEERVNIMEKDAFFHGTPHTF